MTGEILSSVASDSTWWDGLLTVINLIVNMVVFLVSSIKGIFSALGRFVVSIFSGEFFVYINSIFNTLSDYLGSSGASLLMGLFGLVFMIIIFQFIFRLLRGRVNYDSALHKKEYFDKLDKLK